MSAEAEFERCGDSILDGFPTDDIGSCHLPKGHDGMHTPLPVIWQMAGIIDGPWNPNSRASQRTREALRAHPEFLARLQREDAAR